jgi:hypothetical protein
MLKCPLFSCGSSYYLRAATRYAFRSVPKRKTLLLRHHDVQYSHLRSADILEMTSIAGRPCNCELRPRKSRNGGRCLQGRDCPGGGSRSEGKAGRGHRQRRGHQQSRPGEAAEAAACVWREGGRYSSQCITDQVKGSRPSDIFGDHSQKPKSGLGLFPARVVQRSSLWLVAF